MRLGEDKLNLARHLAKSAVDSLHTKDTLRLIAAAYLQQDYEARHQPRHARRQPGVEMNLMLSEFLAHLLEDVRQFEEFVLANPDLYQPDIALEPGDWYEQFYFVSELIAKEGKK